MALDASKALDAKRIFLGSYLGDHVVARYWQQYEPIFVVGGFSQFKNMINGDAGKQNLSTKPVLIKDDKWGRYMESGDAGDQSGLVYSCMAYAIPPDYTIFAVARWPTTPASLSQTIIGNGTGQGVNKPFSYQMTNFSSTREMRFAHDNGPNGEQHKTGVLAKDNEPTTVSYQIRNNTDMQYCIDGYEKTHTLGYEPAAVTPTTGLGTEEHNMFCTQGTTNSSSDAKIYLAVVFKRFIPNTEILHLHHDPASLFERRRIRAGFVPAAAPAAGRNKNLLLMGVG